ncbi:putative galacturonosyltransferase 7 isoform X1 [Iris pallida]|uniref:Hexosyltransferase n=1 Tax=Iris pallida TaxID=29817 RepID=A0AAX6GTM1_IRIPA|nr:putative galacturonosyltransferase 7 isoform X1 [Iris pallida]KAJ6839230.1 putative galacturonosyltransferase 7 isoform X1 [Iris pallida]
MKAYSSSAPAKRRWTCFSVTVPIVVFLSLVGTVSVLLGLHTRFPSGSVADDNSAMGNSFPGSIHVDENEERIISEEESRVIELMEKFRPTLPKAVTNNTTGNTNGIYYDDTTNPRNLNRRLPTQRKDTASLSKAASMNSEGLPIRQVITSTDTRVNEQVENTSKGSTDDATEKSCQLVFGSYCLWSIENKEAMKDEVVKRLKDQLFVARAYYPSIAKLKGQEKLSREMKQNIQEHERMLSEAISDADLPSFAQKKMEKMDQTIGKAKSCTVECSNVDKKLRQLLDLTDDEAHFHLKQSAFLYHLGVQTMPKSHHCLSMRLTVEYFRAPPADIEQLHAHKLDNPSYRHYVVISRNILALSVAINSTVMNAEETENIVFNVLTDDQNYYAMKLWFARNSYKEAAIHVLNLKDLKLNYPYDLDLKQLSPSEEFRISIHNNGQPSSPQMRTEYISVFGHSHFLLPEIFKNLKKVVVLDDDVVVQRDLSPLWDIDLQQKVNGAPQFCGVRLGHLKSYLGISQTDNSCVWMSGLNVVDLERWRELDVTGIYQKFLRKFNNGSDASWRAAALPTSLLAFQDLIFPLDSSWVLSGLGHDYGVDVYTIRDAAALHYNGNMKPWLDLGIPNYKKYWKKFVTQGEQFMTQCNVH